MALATATEVPAIRRSSRIRQQMKSSSDIDVSTSTSRSTKQRSRKIPQRKTPSAKGSKSAPKTFFFLLQLPREIRDMIYSILISTGHLSILRTCREINLEAQSMFYRAAICRQKAGYYHRFHQFNKTFPELLVQNFELRCNLDSSHDPSRRRIRAMQTARKWPVPFQPASYFGRSDIRRNQMVIELELRAKNSPSDAEYIIEQFFDRPESFVGFRLLVVKILPMPRHWKVADKTRIRQVVKDILEPKLGPAVHYEGEDDEGRCIEFHPWSLAGCQSHSLEPVWFLKRAVWNGDGQDGGGDMDYE